MRHDEIIGKVQALAQLPDRGSAENATGAVLRTLGERIAPGLAEHVAAQLPPTLGRNLRLAAQDAVGDGRDRGVGEPFGLAAFTGRVAGRAGVPDETALRDTTAVLEVLDGALSPELMDKVASDLSVDYADLLPSGRADEGRP
ncbi:DUF2267 domain-containing protein [Actinacidiphila rubida]|uniref:Uncharacterized conserved protein, DUF2267 family n=1 Tax=Actinacidiphila rubida TaxID=310780 RepID=A0A1H8JGS9_9ACTN|nr:DUF2267 domain-containing protein [Actinacidiphila rubida]SEN79408.1 Uncharacterized conserved protein, DUF2267 family [Actinacidiphila rubida]